MEVKTLPLCSSKTLLAHLNGVRHQPSLRLFQISPRSSLPFWLLGMACVFRYMFRGPRFCMTPMPLSIEALRTFSVCSQGLQFVLMHYGLCLFSPRLHLVFLSDCLHFGLQASASDVKRQPYRNYLAPTVVWAQISVVMSWLQGIPAPKRHKVISPSQHPHSPPVPCPSSPTSS